MLKLSKKTDYAIILLCRLGEVDIPVSALEMARHYHLPQPMVANILKNLSSAGFVLSTRGQNGGYRLAKRIEEITLESVINVTDNPFNLVECAHDSDICKVHGCPSRLPLIALNQKIQLFMKETTLASIISENVINNPLTQQKCDEATHLS